MPSWLLRPPRLDLVAASRAGVLASMGGPAPVIARAYVHMYVRPARGRQFAPGVDFLKTGLRPKFPEIPQTLTIT